MVEHNLVMLFTKSTCCMWYFCKWIYSVFGIWTSFWMSVVQFFNKPFVVLQQHAMCFSAKLRFAIFWELHDVFAEYEKKLMFLGKVRMICWKWSWIQHLNSTWVNGQKMFVWCRCRFLEKEDRQKNASQTVAGEQLTSLVFLCGKEPTVNLQWSRT